MCASIGAVGVFKRLLGGMADSVRRTGKEVREPAEPENRTAEVRFLVFCASTHPGNSSEPVPKRLLFLPPAKIPPAQC